MDITSETVEEIINRIHAEVIANHEQRRQKATITTPQIEQFARRSDELAEMPGESRLRDFVDRAAPVVRKIVSTALVIGVAGSLVVGGYIYHNSLDQPATTPTEAPDPASNNCPINPFASPEEQYIQAKGCDMSSDMGGSLVAPAATNP